MQKVQAYLKMIIITFKEQPLRKIQYFSPLKAKLAVSTPNIQVSHSPP